MSNEKMKNKNKNKSLTDRGISKTNDFNIYNT